MKINDLRIEIGNVVLNEKRLDELFQMEQAIPWEWTDDNLVYPVEAHFSVDGIDYIAGFYPSPIGDSDDAWITGFAVDRGEEHGTDVFSRFEDGMFDSKGNQIKVFRTVMDIIANFVRGRGPDELHIGAAPERERIYSKLLKRFESQIEQGGYRIASPEYMMFPPYGRVVIFSLEKKEVNNNS